MKRRANEVSIVYDNGASFIEQLHMHLVNTAHPCKTARVGQAARPSVKWIQICLCHEYILGDQRLADNNQCLAMFWLGLFPLLALPLLVCGYTCSARAFGVLSFPAFTVGYIHRIFLALALLDVSSVTRPLFELLFQAKAIVLYNKLMPPFPFVCLSQPQKTTTSTSQITHIIASIFYMKVGLKYRTLLTV